jgi:hypothetical protein
VNKHEAKARFDAQMDEWKRNLDVMKAKSDAAAGDAKVGYAKTVAGLQEQYDEMKIKAAKTWDAADDAWDDAYRDLEAAWNDWSARAMRAWDDIAR